MGLTKYKLGELIELVEETNSEGEFGPDDVRMDQRDRNFYTQ